MHLRTAVAALSPIVLLAGCTAVLSTVKVLQADHQVHEMGARGAAELAPYEYTLAQRYAAKAIQESGDGEIRTSLDLAKIAVVWANAADRKMAGGGRGLERVVRDPLMEDEAPSGATPVRSLPEPTRDEPDTDEDFLHGDDEEEAP